MAKIHTSFCSEDSVIEVNSVTRQYAVFYLSYMGRSDLPGKPYFFVFVFHLFIILYIQEDFFILVISRYFGLYIF